MLGFLQNFAIPRFYILVKIHKPTLAGRPITGACNWLTTGLSRWLHSKLRLLADQLPFVLNNSQSAFDRIRELGTAPPGFRWNLVTLDVASMYPSIPIDLGLRAFNAAVQQFPIFSAEETRAIRAGLVLVLNTMLCVYKDGVFRQTRGTAMGTNVAPDYANIVGHFIEFNTINTLLRDGDLAFYGRFLDDCLALFCEPSDVDPSANPKLLWTSLNNESLHIKFTMESSLEVLAFMDMELYVANGGVCSRIFWKPMHTFRYIWSTSFHAHSQKAGWISGELLRFARLSTFEHDYLRTRMRFWDTLLNRGYPALFLIPIFKVRSFEDRFRVPAQRASDAVYCVVPDNPTTRYLIYALCILALGLHSWQGLLLTSAVLEPPHCNACWANLNPLNPKPFYDPN